MERRELVKARWGVVSLVFALVSACSGAGPVGSTGTDSGASCAAGDTRDCVCASGATGVQICGSTGAFGACVGCAAVADAGPGLCGATNPNGQCPSGQTCMGGQCASPCSATSPGGFCPAGQTCIGGACCASPCSAACCLGSTYCVGPIDGANRCVAHCTTGATCGAGSYCAAIGDGAGGWVADDGFCVPPGSSAGPRRCTTDGDCTNGQACAPTLGSDGIPRLPYVCTDPACAPYRQCRGLLGSCPNGYCNLCDGAGRCFCAQVCTSEAMCGGAACRAFGTSRGSCAATQTACTPR